MSRILLLTLILALPLLAGCGTAKTPMKSTGAPCGYHAVDAGICPAVGYKVPYGEMY